MGEGCQWFLVRLGGGGGGVIVEAGDGLEKGGIAYRKTCFSPFGGVKRSGTRGRRGSGKGARIRAGLGRMRGTAAAAALAMGTFMMALGLFMICVTILESKDVDVSQG